MIEGDLADVSLPGLLQCLATESNNSFRVQLTNGSLKGELIVSAGEILAANFGLLEGNDALTEFLFWNEGHFQAERFDPVIDSAFSTNLKIALRQLNSFADQILFLQKANVGLNTEIVPSPKFGTQEWQEALQKLPLYKEDYVVLGWVTDGRTMREAMREFNFDVVLATSALFRLLCTGSVECIRPQLDSLKIEHEPEAVVEPEKSIVQQQTVVLEPKSEAKTEPALSVREKPSKAKAKIESGATSSGNGDSGAAAAVLEPEPDLLPDFAMEEPEPVAVVSTSSTSFAVVAPESPIPPAAAALDVRNIEVITSDSLPAVGSKEFMDLMAMQKAKPVEAPVKVEEPQRSFDIRRTDPLPLVAIDIERLFQTCFHVAPFGQVALANNALDEEMKKIVSAFKAGKTFINVATDGGHGRDPAQVLHTVKYALERGYIDPPDQVVSLTADLLLGRVELEQYLLQRRRLNGDELRDVIELAKAKGVKLVELLVKMAFMTESDWDRLNQEKERFAPR